MGPVYTPTTGASPGEGVSREPAAGAAGPAAPDVTLVTAALDLGGEPALTLGRIGVLVGWLAAPFGTLQVTEGGDAPRSQYGRLVPLPQSTKLPPS